jgi:hypothetical protein
VTHSVVDTGVLVVANGRSVGVDWDCVRACVDALDAARRGVLVLDRGMLIFQEYQAYGSFSGQPGVGDAFFKWVVDNRYNEGACELVPITDHAERRFEEFPDDEALESFDRDDRKFVAAALVSTNQPSLRVATDSDWWNHRTALGNNGVRLVFVCPDHFTRREAPHGRQQPRPCQQGAGHARRRTGSIRRARAESGAG